MHKPVVRRKTSLRSEGLFAYLTNYVFALHSGGSSALWNMKLFRMFSHVGLATCVAGVQYAYSPVVASCMLYCGV